MKKKNLLALLLIVAMLVTVFAACSTTEEQPNNSDAGTSSPTPDGGDEGDGGNDGEITEINYWCWDVGNSGQNTKWDLVYEAINEVTEREIGVHVNFTWVASADYGTQLTLALSNNEQIDIADYQVGGGAAFTKLLANGSMMDITELSKEHASELLEPQSMAFSMVSPPIAS